MNVTSATSTTTASTQSTNSTATTATNTLSYNDFLTLLVSELKNQDPTQPMDPSQMVTQLATVSQVGQAVQTNTNLTALLTSSALSQAEQLVGQTVTSADGGTSGVVVSVNVGAGSSTATLADGSTVSLGQGVTITQ